DGSRRPARRTVPRVQRTLQAGRGKDGRRCDLPGDSGALQGIADRSGSGRVLRTDTHTRRHSRAHWRRGGGRGDGAAMSTDPIQLQRILEAALLAAARPLDLDELLAIFPEQERPDRTALRNALADLREQYESHAIELREVASGWRIQIRSDYT